MSAADNNNDTTTTHSSTLPNTNSIYLFLENPRPNNNLGSLLRCAAAYNIHTIIVVGYDRCAVQGSHGANKHVQLISFPTHPQAVDYIKTKLQCTQLIGILGGAAGAYETEGYAAVVLNEETDMVYVSSSSSSSSLTTTAASSSNDDTTNADQSTISHKRSFPISTRPFIPGNCCFAVSRKWAGLPLSLARHCDSFVHVPHVSIRSEQQQISPPPPLLDSPSVLSIVLHHYTAYANYDERNFEGHKFQVNVGGRRDVLQARQQETRARREQNRAEDGAAEDVHANLGLFGEAQENGESSDY